MSAVDDLLARFPSGPEDPQFLDELVGVLSEPFQDGLMSGTKAIGGAIELGVANDRAVAWARDYGARLVTQVDDTSKELIRNLVTEELRAGVVIQDLTDDLMKAFGDFAEYRAERIARTETALAFNHGTIGGYRDAGVEYVEVLDGPGCLPDGHDDDAGPPAPDVYGIQEDAEANGQIWSLDEAAGYPVGHPNCVRAFAAVTFPPPAEEE
ncbi:MAG: hypothetical protein ABSD47_01135 [Candidatus Methylomirabilota bacterium]|jgi:hypothetical protein